MKLVGYYYGVNFNSYLTALSVCKSFSSKLRVKFMPTIACHYVLDTSKAFCEVQYSSVAVQLCSVFRRERRLKVLDSTISRRISGSGREGATTEPTKLYELRSLYDQIREDRQDM
jgi:hypothetical protein